MTDTKQATGNASEQGFAKTEHRLPALAVSRGVGVGRVVFLHGETRQFFRTDLDPDHVGPEIARFAQALDASKDQLHLLAAGTEPDTSQPVSGIFGVHLLILESSFVEKIESVIQNQRVNAEWAIRTVADQYLERQASITDLHFRDKYLDIEDVANRLLTALAGSTLTEQTDTDAVIVARDLRPSAIMELAKSKPAAFVTEHGGWTSHSSILAREFGLPMVSGVRNLEQFVANDDLIIVDGTRGEVIVNPGRETLRQFEVLLSEETIAHGTENISGKELTTLDGTPIMVRANVDLAAGYSIAKRLGARGIGLFRSESLIRLPGVIPSEEAQVLAYRHMSDVTGSEGVRIRTFDIGIDMHGNDEAVSERNPSLGLRSIRLSLTDPKYFLIQAQALLRASFDRKIDIILPMVSGVGDVLRAKALIDEARAHLAAAGIAAGNPGLGAMIETPSAVLTANQIAANVDFMCLGTNDLVQYLLAVDRDNEAVAGFYQTLHPAVIVAIENVILAGERAGVPVAVCGEMAGSAFYVPVLIGLGARELSVNVNSIQPVWQLLSGISISEAEALVKRVKDCKTTDEIESLLHEYYSATWSGMFPPGLLQQGSS